MRYLLPDVEVLSIWFDKDDPSKATVLVLDKAENCERDMDLHVMLKDGDTIEYSNRELVG